MQESALIDEVRSALVAEQTQRQKLSDEVTELRRAMESESAERKKTQEDVKDEVKKIQESVLDIDQIIEGVKLRRKKHIEEQEKSRGEVEN